MAKGRRKLRRQLIKKMKKGYLTPGEREDLMELDREVNRANRQGAAMTGAGLGTALAIASKTGALGNAGDALGDWLDQRAAKKQFQADTEAMGDYTAREVQSDQIAALNKEIAADEEARKEALAAAEKATKEKYKDVTIEQEEEDFEDDTPSFNAADDLLPYLNSSTRPLGPFREDFEEWQGVRDRAEALREARALLPTEEQEKWERRERLMDEYLESKRPEEGNMERIVGPGADPYSDPEGMGARKATMFPSVEITPEFSWEDLQKRGGPRVQNEDGGYTPFLRAMRSKIRKKYLR